MGVALGVLAAFLLVAANAFFVATEFALARVRMGQVEQLEEEGRAGARALRHGVENIDTYLAACQLGITIASIGLGAISKPAFEEVVAPISDPLGRATGIAATTLAFAFAFGLVTLMHVVLGELAPKSLAISRTRQTAVVLAVPMRLFYLASKPFVDFFNWLGNLVLKPFGIPPAREVGHAPHTEDELRQLLEQSLREGLIDPEEREFAENVFTFGDRRARHIMVPRPEIVYLTTEETLCQAAERATASGHTRLPLCEPEGGLDTVVGVVNAKDLLGRILDQADVPLRELARPLRRVSESTLVDELLRELRSNREHVALVVDEYGTAVGLVTLEDILEEIVGEIEDEFDPATASLIVYEDGAARVSGTAPIDVVAEELGLEVEDPREATIGGHVLKLLGRVPNPGETVEVEGRRAEVTAVSEAQIIELRF
ncbi:MAG: hemolysin family protein, partial [Actinomycetota bacterium]|nr:hemolysin family protein [Actinomycetota bacterium]